MFRWRDVEDTTTYGMVVKMYRKPYEADEIEIIENKGSELDHYAFLHLGSELFMYRIMDTNWTEFMENRGDVQKMINIKIPTRTKQ